VILAPGKNCGSHHVKMFLWTKDKKHFAPTWSKKHTCFIVKIRCYIHFIVLYSLKIWVWKQITHPRL